MNTTINKVCSDLNQLAISLENSSRTEIQKMIEPTTHPHTAPKSSSHTSHPDRPWMIAGGLAVAGGIIGAFATKGVWPYVIGASGLVSMVYGKTIVAKNDNEPVINEHRVPAQSYEIVEKIINLSKSIESKWRESVEHAKTIVQGEIESANVDSETKNRLLSMTYITERVSIDTAEVSSDIESQPVEYRHQILMNFLSQVIKDINNTFETQVNIYNSISKEI